VTRLRGGKDPRQQGKFNLFGGSENGGANYKPFEQRLFFIQNVGFLKLSAALQGLVFSELQNKNFGFRMRHFASKSDCRKKHKRPQTIFP